MFFKRFALAALAAAPFICVTSPASAEGMLTELRIGVLDHDSDLLRERHEIFADFTLGGAIHDGETTAPSSGSRQYGCRLGFHESFSLGYSFDGHNAIMLGVDHMSNASLCDKNDGLTNLGIRYAYKF